MELQHLLSVDQLDRTLVEQIMSLAASYEPIARREKVCRVLEGAILGNLFFEASTRTRVSFGAAFNRLGGAVCDTTGFTFSSMAKGESIYDTSRVVSGYVDVLVIRHPEKGAVRQFAEATNIPVINGGDGPGEHPTQALLDVYTVSRELKRTGREIDGSHIMMVGDLKYGRTVHSLIKLLSMYKRMHFTLVSPTGLRMPGVFIEHARAAGHTVTEAERPEGTSVPIHVLYTTRIQKERFQETEMEGGYTPAFVVNKALVEKICTKYTVIMHPLPRDSAPGSNDLSTDLNHDVRLAIFRQTDAGIPVRMAVFAKTLGVENLVLANLRTAKWSRPAQIGPDDAAKL